MDEEQTPATLFNDPIAGESLTAEMGAFPWQRPPEMSTVDETVAFYSDKISEEKTSAGLVALMDSGIAIKTIVDTTVDAGVMNGLHTIDVGTLVSPVLLEMLMYMAEVSGVEYTTGLEDDGRNETVEKAMAFKVMKEFAEKTKDVKKPKEEEKVIEEPMEMPPKGLMARPTPEPVTDMPMEEPVSEGVM